MDLRTGRITTCLVSVLSLVALAAAPPAARAASPVIEWEYDQLRPALAHNPENDTYLVVWEDHHWGFGNDWDIYGRLVAADGTPLGAAFGIGFADEKHRLAPTVAYNPQVDEFLVVYEYELSASDHDLYARRVSAAGAPVGDEIALVAPGDLDALPALSYNPVANEYLLVWQRRVGSDEFFQWDVIGIRVSAAAATIGDGIAVAVGTTSQSAPAAAYGALNDQYLVVWEQPGADGRTPDVYGQRLAANGSLIGGAIPVSTAGLAQSAPRVAFDDAANHYLVVWEDSRAGTDQGRDIYGQRITAGGFAEGGNFAISGSGETSHRSHPAVVFHGDAGEFVVAFEAEASPTDPDVWTVRVREDGPVAGSEFAVSYTGATETRPAVAPRAGESFLVAWEDGRSQIPSGGLDVYVERVRMPLFSGHVYSGEVGDRSEPLAGVRVQLFCGNDPQPPGELQDTAFTDEEGRYGVTAGQSCEYFHIVASDFPDYESVGAVSVGGTVVDANRIRYELPLTGKALEGNDFWDRPVATASPTRTRTTTPAPTATPTRTATASATRTHTPSPTPTATQTTTATEATTATATETATATSTVTATGTATPSASPTASPTATSLPTSTAPPQEYPIWRFTGRVVGPRGDAVADVEVRLLGGVVSARPGQLLDYAQTGRDGSFALTYTGIRESQSDFSYLNLLVPAAGLEPVRAVPAEGGEAVAGNWIQFESPTPGTYADNVFEVRAVQEAGVELRPIRLCAAADAWIGSDAPDTSHVGGTFLRTGHVAESGWSYRALARFDPSWVPADTEVASAEIQAYLEAASGAGSVDIGLYPVVAPWSTGVTWNTQPAVGESVAAAAVGTRQGDQTWGVTDLVRGWLDGDIPNHGVELRGPETGPDWVRDFGSFLSSEDVRLVLHQPKEPVPAPANPLDPRIVVSPDWGETGARLTVSGYNLPPSTTLSLYWDYRAPAHILGQAATDDLGALTTEVNVPSGAAAGIHPGIHAVLLYLSDPIEGVYRLLAQARFVVEPRCWSEPVPPARSPKIAASPVQGPSNGGNDVQVTGTGWRPSSRVDLYWDDPQPAGNSLGFANTDGQGNFVKSIKVPTNAAGAYHLMLARINPFTYPVEQAAAEYRMTDTPSPPANDSQPPTVQVAHSFAYGTGGGPGIDLYLTAKAWDPQTAPGTYNGISRIEISAYAMGMALPPIKETCVVDGWVSATSCSHTERGPWPAAVKGFFYTASATDRSGNVASSPVKFAWLIDYGTDSDNDGLSNSVEDLICTDTNNPDTDRDNLLDGWEVEGYQFLGGTFVDLPSMGAHPCVPDSFVEIDWLPGNRPQPQAELQPVVNAYADHGIKLRIDHGQWGGGDEIPSMAGALQNHFAPDRLWSFHYTVFRPPGQSYCERGKVAYVGPGDRPFTFMHELGHCTGLGHGGSKGPNTQKRSGTPAQQQSWGFQWVWYDQDAESTNNAPNYLSVMSYSFNGIVWVPGTGFVFPLVHSEEVLPDVNESALDERASSAFVQALRSSKLPPGVPANGVRATMYSCLDPDDGNVYILVTNGHQLLARHLRGNPWPMWQLTNLPAQDALGIDWDCDGKIEASVSTNINGCSGECFLNTVQDGWQPGQAVTTWTPGETLTGTADWTRIPALDPCPGDLALGAGYVHSAHDPPCESNGWAPASIPEDEDPPWERLPPGEWCNGRDDDGDQAVDEGCLDGDADGVVDGIDNCPRVSNPAQEDRDLDLRGDACSLPPAPPTGLTAERETGGVALTWQASIAPGILGYNVYRRAGAEADFTYLGALWPSTAETSFDDAAAPAGSLGYRLRTVDAEGVESEPAEAEIAGCTGDCDGRGTVTVDELVLGVNIALGQAEVSACAAFDDNDSGTVTVDELVRGVNHALDGCPQ